MIDVLVLGGVVLLVAVASVWWRSRDGRVRHVDDRFTDEQLAGLQAPYGHLLLVLFTAPSCAPCAATRHLLDEVAGSRPRVTVRTVDVGDAIDLARAHRVLRAPTTFVVQADGAVRGRIGGIPERADLVALLDEDAARRAA